MTPPEIKDYLTERGYDNAVILTSPDYAAAFIGMTTDGRAVYDFERMCQAPMDDDGMDYEEAAEFIEYNTVRALPYAGDRAPVIIYPLEAD